MMKTTLKDEKRTENPRKLKFRPLALDPTIAAKL